MSGTIRAYDEDLARVLTGILLSLDYYVQIKLNEDHWEIMWVAPRVAHASA